MIEFLVSLSTSIYLKVAESEEIQVPCCTMILTCNIICKLWSSGWKIGLIFWTEILDHLTIGILLINLFFRRTWNFAWIRLVLEPYPALDKRMTIYLSFCSAEFYKRSYSPHLIRVERCVGRIGDLLREIYLGNWWKKSLLAFFYGGFVQQVESFHF